jgi:hypothetical protein
MTDSLVPHATQAATWAMKRDPISPWTHCRRHGLGLLLLIFAATACDSSESADEDSKKGDGARPRDTAGDHTGLGTDTQSVNPAGDTSLTGDTSPLGDTATEPPALPSDTGMAGRDTAADTDLDVDTGVPPDVPSLPCETTPWGSSCKVGNQIYDMSFSGLDMSDSTEKEISFTSIRCAGYNAAVMIAGDSWCPSCPMWYEEVGKHIDDIHARGGAVVASSTDQFGAANLPNEEAAASLAGAHPDYVTGIDPYIFPCRYTFTPFTMVVNLRTGTILGKDTEAAMLSIDAVLEMVASANE